MIKIHSKKNSQKTNTLLRLPPKVLAWKPPCFWLLATLTREGWPSPSWCLQQDLVDLLSLVRVILFVSLYYILILLAVIYVLDNSYNIQKHHLELALLIFPPIDCFFVLDQFIKRMFAVSHNKFWKRKGASFLSLDALEWSYEKHMVYAQYLLGRCILMLCTRYLLLQGDAAFSHCFCVYFRIQCEPLGHCSKICQYLNGHFQWCWYTVRDGLPYHCRCHDQEQGRRAFQLQNVLSYGWEGICCSQGAPFTSK